MSVLIVGVKISIGEFNEISQKCMESFDSKFQTFVETSGEKERQNPANDFWVGRAPYFNAELFFLENKEQYKSIDSKIKICELLDFNKN